MRLTVGAASFPVVTSVFPRRYGCRRGPASLGPVSGPANGSVAGDEPGHPGERLGLPVEGPGSVAGLGRRLLALLVDWGLCLLIAAGFALDRVWGPSLVLLVEQTLLVGLLGYSIGHRLLGLTVARLDGAPVGPGRGFVRALLLCLAIPAIVMDRDGRGLHDQAAGTVVVRR